MRKMKLGILLVVALLALVSCASAFPPLPTSLTITHPITAPGPNSYFRIHVLTTTPTGNEYLPIGYYDGMCMGWKVTGVGPFHSYKVYDSRTVTPAQLPTYIATVDWKKINWVANHLYDDGNAATTKDWVITQAAIWRLGDADDGSYPADGITGPFTVAMKGALNTYYSGISTMVPSQPNEWYAVILVKDYYTSAGVHIVGQPILIRVQIPPEDEQVPEFPTLALPVALLVGIAGAVEYIRTKKE
jgi:hypothetical protein